MGARDLIIVGAGPAGLSAAIYAARMGLDVLVVEKGIAGGLMLEIPFIENYPGFPGGVSGPELARLMVEQAKSNGAEIRELEEAVELDLKGDVKVVETSKASHEDTLALEEGAIAQAAVADASPPELLLPGDAQPPVR